MKTIILPGYSPHNKQWADQIKASLHLSHKIIVHNWKHWESGGGLSLKFELEKIMEEVGSDRFNVIAKSVGTFVAAKLLLKSADQIEKIILCGIPSTSEKREDIYQKVFGHFPAEKIICFQNKEDPFAPYDEVKDFIQKINPKIEVVQKERSDHSYPYSEDFERFLKR